MVKNTTHIFIFVIFFLFIASQNSTADTIEQIQKRIDIANKNREQLEKEIANYQNQLKVVGDQANNLQNTIKSLDISTNKITSEVKLVENNISKTSAIIDETDNQITDKNKQISLSKTAIKESLKRIHEADESTIWELLLSERNFSYFWNNLEDTIRVQAKINQQVDTVKKIKADLEEARYKLDIQKKDLEQYTKELADQKKVLLSTKQEKNNLLTVTKNTEANYQKILQDKLALKEALDKEINAFEAELRLAIDPKSFPKAGKGILAWPLDNVFITQYFGKTSDSGRLYVSGTHNGVDFRASIGTRIKSAGNGTVEGIGDTDIVCPGASYGKWVLIRHDNGLATLYAHLSIISSKPGQKVKVGDIIGYSGNTGYSTGPHLHFGVYASQGVKISTLKSSVCKGIYTIPLADPKAYLDPLIYL